MALLLRARTGGGQRVETSLLDAAALLNADAVAQCDSSLDSLSPRSQYGLHALHRLYETAMGWICVVAETDDDWRALSRTLGVSGLTDDARFVTAASRGANDDALSGILGVAFKTKVAGEWLRELEAAGVPSAPVSPCRRHVAR